jgi:hypothetical protein|uniref:Uncharacterized protein n=1 Tax=Zea mays TaxID=4577 RepID=C0P3D7_MAIZE|nr:unknown [Zea mays]
MLDLLIMKPIMTNAFICHLSVHQIICMFAAYYAKWQLKEALKHASCTSTGLVAKLAVTTFQVFYL